MWNVMSNAVVNGNACHNDSPGKAEVVYFVVMPHQLIADGRISYRLPHVPHKVLVKVRS
jgi:hypothetical protein